MDEGVGQIIKVLEDANQLERTVIVYTSDQGFAWGDHGFAHKLGPYEACMRMPMIIRWPGEGARGTVCRHPVAVVDLPPTLFAFAGQPLPWEMHGHDLQPILQKPDLLWEHPVLLEHFEQAFGSQTDKGGDPGAGARTGGIPWWISLRKDQHKYIRTLAGNEIEELYDLENDPQEMHNLALDPRHRERLEDYRRRLVAELWRTHAGLVQNLPPPRAP